ncbi:MAG: prolyl oligopeptidase family serine peptidase [Bryobacteraceae bacterium]
MNARSFVLTVAALASLAWAAERPVPPPGIAVPAADRQELETGLAQLHQRVEDLRANPLAADVEIYEKAVRWALQYNEFFKPQEIARAKDMLNEGLARAESLARGEAPWNTATGLVVRAYVSKIDRSVQPYGLVVPPSYSPNSPHRWRLDTWFHGRGETLSELNFLYDREHNPGEFTPPDTIVLHLYGRYCNANKFAGEVDLFEALADVKKHYAIDDNRIVVRGFSMGGASTWQFATHYAGLWAAASPGAGFAETPDFLNVFRSEKVPPTWWEQKLWHLYNSTEYAANLYDLPVVAYSGEIDRQKQAADIMAVAMEREHLRLIHIIGPNTGHKYEPHAKLTVARLVDALAARGRDAYPSKLRFTTWTLRYNRMKWLTVDGLEHHWQRARADADITSDHSVDVRTVNVTALTLHMGAGHCPFDPASEVSVTLNGETLSAPSPTSDRSWTAHFANQDGRWRAVGQVDTSTLAKRHGLQGPIDDAFMDSFIMVRPTGAPLDPGSAGWVKSEMSRAIVQWRSQFRGDALVRDDTAITDADIQSSNLILWGDPGSNRVLARIASRLPIHWTADAVIVGGEKFAASSHSPILIFPNPLNPKRYVVLNSGFTFREYDALNNARQVPKLPDWAVVDLTVPPDGRYPGKIAAAGFFDEQWRLSSNSLNANVAPTTAVAQTDPGIRAR